MSRLLAHSLRALVCTSATALVLAATGCGIGTADHTVSSSPLSFSGNVHGGESPIIYSKVTFYETSPTGTATTSGVSASGVSTAGVYVGTATALGSTYTDINGNFSFSTPLSCSSSADYVYAVAAGGNSGSYPGTLNRNLLLSAAVGSCSGLGAGTTVIINELSTVAASYALSGFTSVTGTYTSSVTAASFVVVGTQGGIATLSASTSALVSGQPISAITRNGSAYGASYFVATASGNTVTVSDPALLPGDTLTGTYTTVTAVPAVNITASSNNYGTPSVAGTTAAGLAHGFTTANLLITPGVAQANTVSPNNPLTTISTSMINTLGNILQSCVNSTGGVAGDSTNCGTLFTNTTAPVTGAAAPTNTLSAALNLAHFPSQNVANLFTLEPPTGAAFNPSLAAAPHDFSLAIAFMKYSGNTNGDTADASTNGLFYPYSLALDGNDDVYVLNGTASTNTSSNVVAFTSDGTPKWATNVDTSRTSITWIATDLLGNVAYQNAAATGNILFLSAASGGTPAVFSTLNFSRSLVFDPGNDLLVGYSSNTAAASTDVRRYPYVSANNPAYNSASSGYTAFTLPATGGYAYQVALAPHGDIWASQESSSAVGFGLIPADAGSSSGFDAQVTTSGATEKTNYGVAVDSSNNAWFTGTADFVKVVPTVGTGGVYTGGVGSVAATYVPTGGTASLRFLTIDGNNTLWSEDNNSTNSALVSYNTTAATPVLTLLRPCISATATTCPALGSTVPGIYGPRNSAVDSAGNVWVASSTNGEIVEVIGAAAPSWPAIAVTKPGQMP